MYTYLLIVCFSIFLFIKQYEKQNNGLNYLLLLVEAVFLIFSINNSDYSSYYDIYSGRVNIPIEKGFKATSVFLRGIGLESYTYFLILVMLLIAFVFWKWGKLIPNINYVLFFYALFLMYYDCIQIRNTIATFLILYAMYLSLHDKIAPALVVCLAAVFFHRLGFLLALILIYIMIFKPRKGYEISKLEIALHVFVGAFVVVFGRKILLFLAGKGGIFFKLYDYLAETAGFDSLIIWAGSTTGMLILLWYFGVRKVLSSDNTSVPEIRKKAVNYLFRYCLFNISCSGFLLFLIEFNRIYRLFELMLFMIFALIQSEMSWKSKRVIFFVFFAVNVIFMLVAIPRGVNLDTFFIK